MDNFVRSHHHDSFGNHGVEHCGDASDRSSSQEGEEGPHFHDADTRSLCSQRSDPGYNSAGALSDGGGNHSSFEHGGHNPMSSMRSVGSVGSQGSGERSFGSSHFQSAHGRLYPCPPGAAHLMNGETQFPPSMYHSASDAAKSDVATVCSGSVVEDIEEESVVSEEASNSMHPSPPSSVRMAFGGGIRRSNSAEGNRLVDFADRSQELLAAVIPQQRGGLQPQTSSTVAGLPTHEDTDMGMGPPLSRSLLLQGACSSRPGSVKSFESNAGSDVVAHVDTDDCGGSVNESITDAHSVHSREEAMQMSDSGDQVPPPIAAGLDANLAPDKESSTHPLLSNSSSSPNGRMSPGGTIYKGRGVRRYKGRYMHLPLKRFHQHGVHLRSVEENMDDTVFNRYSTHHEDHQQWSEDGKEMWERSSGRDDRGRPSYRNTRRNGWKSSRSRSRSRSRSADNPMNGDEEDSIRYQSDRKQRARRSNGNYHSSGHEDGSTNGYHGNPSSSSRHRGYRSRERSGSRSSRSNSHDGSSSTRNCSRNKHRHR